MKTLILLVFTLMISALTFGQTVCPVPVTVFNFTYTKPVTLNQKIGGIGYCEPDAGQTVVLSLSGSAFFRITATGDILISDAAAINNSPSVSYVLSVKATDNGIPVMSSTAVVNMSEGNSAPVINIQTFSIAENSLSGTNIGPVIATDADNGQVLAYSIISGNTGNTFALSPSGVLTVSNNLLLNYEANTKFTLLIKVTDSATVPLSSQAEITINVTNVNEAPILTNQKP